ncbi:hypothetical protein GJV04_06460 [Enterobacteriaceae bacterium RIT714]|nr:hypothetical protein [Enterobacteriaceae bacterium RIT714]
MKWLNAKNLNIRLAVFIILLLSGLQSVYTLSHAKLRPTASKGLIEIGFYDLLADQQENYNVQLMDMNGAMLITITRPDDAMFLIKGRLDDRNEIKGRTFFSYNPVRYSNPRDYKMIFSFVDFLRHNDVWVYPLAVNKQPLVICQSGLMFIHSLKS